MYIKDIGDSDPQYVIINVFIMYCMYGHALIMRPEEYEYLFKTLETLQVNRIKFFPSKRWKSF